MKPGSLQPVFLLASVSSRPRRKSESLIGAALPEQNGPRCSPKRPWLPLTGLPQPEDY